MREFPLLRYEWWLFENLLCIKCHLSNKTCFRFGAAGLYCGTKGKISLGCLSFFCSSTDSLSVNLMSARSFSIRHFG